MAGTQSISVTTNTRFDINQKRTEEVWDIVATSIHDSAGDEAVTEAIPFNGIIRHITITIPDTTTDNTTSQILIKDNGDNTVFDSGELAEGATHNFSVDLPLSGTIDVSVEPSAAAGAGGNTTTVGLRGI